MYLSKDCLETNERYKQLLLRMDCKRTMLTVYHNLNGYRFENKKF